MSVDLMEDVYPLAPLQEGLLFHHLSEPGSTMYVEQMAWAFEGQFDPAAYCLAWQAAIDRHPILRTGFIWRGLDDPVQVVFREARLPLRQEDWRSLSLPQQQLRLKQLLDEERQRGFDLAQAPLLRLVLTRLGDDMYHTTWTFQHLLLDGWSASILVSEIFAHYRALRTGQPFDPPRTAPYRQFISWLKQQDSADAERFWRATLQDFATPTNLPIGSSAAAPGAALGRPGEYLSKLSEPASRALQTLVRREHLTLNTVVQGAWAVLLSRYCGESDVMFGTTVSIRPPALANVEGTLGLLINTLPVRCEVPAEATVLNWLRELQAEQASARQHAHVSLADIQRWTTVPKDQPLFDTLLVFENYPLDNLTRVLSDLGLTLRDPRNSVDTNYALNLLVFPGNELSLRLVFDTERFGQPEIGRLAGHLQTLLQSIAAEPNQKLSELTLLTEAERHQVLVEWNQTGREYPCDRSIHALFEEQAARTPQVTAVVFQGQQLTYGQLNARANRLAHQLRSLGIRRETLVGICAERSLELVVGVLGILKAGGAYVPLDPDYPADRLKFMLDDTGVGAVVGLSAQLSRLPGMNRHLVALDSDSPALLTESEDNLSPDASARDLAYVLYTSGSTGQPKGVAVEHRSVVRLVKHTNFADFGPNEVFLHFAPLSFDASTLELWAPLLNGGRLVVAPPGVLSLSELGKTITDNAVTTLWLTAGLFHAMVDNQLSALSNVRQLLAGGDVLSVPHVERVLRELPECQLINGYGPTENTTFTCCYPARVPADLQPTVPIGRPIANTTVYILDTHRQPVPVGVPGELYIGGNGLARGYLQRPELTAEKFVPHLFSSDPDAVLYRTGDLVRYRVDGNIEFLGRIDQQVKIRGFRIEPGEIEAILQRHAAVREAAVVAREERSGGKRLVGYIVPEDGRVPDPGELRAFLEQHLPEYMVPATFIPLNELPLTANGKVDRAALPAPDRAQRNGEADTAAPLTDAERTISAIWSDTLEVEHIARDDNFFDLGGNSLLAMRVHDKLQNAFGPGVKMIDLFHYPTVSGLARHLAGEAAMPVAANARARGDRRREALGRFRPRPNSSVDRP